MRLKERLTSGVVYGNISIPDYEHSGDSRLAYELLKKLGIKDTGFEYNGDGCVAFINIEFEYNKDLVQRIKKTFDDTFYGVGLINLDDFEGKTLYETMPYLATFDNLPNFSVRSVKDNLPSEYRSSNNCYSRRNGKWDCLLRVKDYINTFNGEKLDKIIELFKSLDCTEFSYDFNDMEIFIYGKITASNLRNHFREIYNRSFFGDSDILISVLGTSSQSYPLPLKYLEKHFYSTFDILRYAV